MIHCWLHQKLAALRPARDGAGPRRPQAHLNRCSRCRDAVEQEAALGEQLRLEAYEQRHPAPRFLTARIMRAVERPAPGKDAPATSWLPRWSLAAAGFAAVGIAAALILPGTGRGPGPAPERALTQVPAATARISRTLAASAGGTLREVGGTFNAPLEQEIASLRKDSRTVLESLASNFLPERTLAGGPGR